jgi:hypothetical protein
MTQSSPETETVIAWRVTAGKNSERHLFETERDAQLMRDELEENGWLDVVLVPLYAGLAQSQQQWQPVETAPKDGTFIDLWFPNNGTTALSQRLTGTWRHDAWFMQSGGRSFRMDNPTHWMPLPAGPTDTSTLRTALPTERSCQCDSPVIRCDNRGCRCTICGELERLPVPNHREGEHQS